MDDWSSAPAVLIFGDSEAGLAELSDCATAAGGRVAAALPMERAGERLDSQVAVDLVIVDVGVDLGPELDELLYKIQNGAAARRFASAVIVTPQLLDIAVARVDLADVSVLVGRDPAALRVAIREHLGGPALLRESNDESVGNGRYKANGAEYAVSAESGEGSAEVSRPGESRRAELKKSLDAGVIRDLIRARRLRDELFGPGLFADPAWDILLDLSAAQLEGRPVAVSSLCIAAAVPATTALRWIKQLTEAGLLQRVADPADGRRVFIELTERAAAKMTSYFAAVHRSARY